MPGMHEIEYKIVGDDLQYVEVELDPHEATVAEAGGMMYMDDGIRWRPSSAMDLSRRPGSWERSWVPASGC
jgi:uncharacterized protein (AIM24 family)